MKLSDVAQFLPKLGPDCVFTPKKTILAKLTVTIVHILYTFMLQHLKTILKEQIIRKKVA